MDAPRHGTIRKLVSAAFTPKQIQKIERPDREPGEVRIVDDLLANPEGDFVEQVSKRLPMWTIYEMMGLDDEERRLEAAHHADGMVSWADEDVAAGREPGEVLNDSLVGLLMMGMELAEERRADPRERPDDQPRAGRGRRPQAHRRGDRLVLRAAVRGRQRHHAQLASASAPRAFQQFPDQKALLMEDFDGRIGAAIEEFVRWVSPVMTFRRTATQDTELGGQQIREGEWVAMIYSSGNRDERVFDDPHAFDITPEAEPARRLRWRRAALLHGQLRRQDAAARDLRPAAVPRADLAARRAGVPRRQLRPRRQAHALHASADGDDATSSEPLPSRRPHGPDALASARRTRPADPYRRVADWPSSRRSSRFLRRAARPTIAAAHRRPTSVATRSSRGSARSSAPRARPAYARQQPASAG